VNGFSEVEGIFGDYLAAAARGDFAEDGLLAAACSATTSVDAERPGIAHE